MNPLVAIVGSTGVGKTTLANALCAAGDFQVGLEQIPERPFQAHFAFDLHRYALANQVDFLIYRADQEAALRAAGLIAIMDGGLDQDYHIFTHLFHHKGYLSQDEFDLCTRLYTTLRRWLPPPALVIRLTAPPGVIADRYARRGRPFEIAQREDIAAIETLLDAWLSRQDAPTTLLVDASSPHFPTAEQVGTLLKTISKLCPPNI